MPGLTIYDYLLFPIYFYIIYLIFKKLQARYADNKNLLLYFTWGFKIKMAIVIGFTLLTNFVIRGDSVDLYFGEGKHFAQIIKDDPSKIGLLFTKANATIDDLATENEKGYLLMENNYMVVKISVILCLMSFSCFFIVNLILGFIAFLSSWKLYLFFLKQYPHLDKQFAFACMGIPTVLFWSSGISKDTVCMICVGVLTSSLFSLFTNYRQFTKHILFIAICIYLIYSIKPYIILSYMPFFFFFLLLYKINQTRNRLFKFLLKALIPAGFIITMIAFYFSAGDMFENFSSDKILEKVSNTQNAFIGGANTSEGSYFTLGDFHPSIGGFLKMAPKAVGTTFFRPFIWESRNLIMLISALENMVLLFFTLRGIIYLLRSRKQIRNSIPILIYCFGFAIVFAAFVGISSFNFGSLVRYKIPCIPFFVIGVIILSDKKIMQNKNTLAPALLPT